MTGTLLLPILAFIFSAICGFVFIPQILKFCQKKNLYDIPNKRKVHKNAIPRLGGISFMPSMAVASFIALAVLSYNNRGNKIGISPWAISFAIGMIIIYTTGLIDDIIGLTPMTKFTAQIIAAIMLPASWLYINDLYGFFGIFEIPYFIGAPLTVFVLVFIMNAFNLIDGIDGLSGTLSLIALLGYFYCFYKEGYAVYCILIAGLAGIVFSFLYFNIWGDPNKNKKIFMGDSGSLTLGYILGTLFVKCSMNNPNVMHYSKESMLVAFTLLIVPIFDVVRVIIVRLIHHEPIFKADKNHIHHKLMRAGLSQHKSLIVIISLAIFYIFFNTILFNFLSATVIVILDVVLYTVFHYTIDYRIKQRGLNPYSQV